MVLGYLSKCLSVLVSWMAYSYGCCQSLADTLAFWFQETANRAKLTPRKRSFCLFISLQDWVETILPTDLPWASWSETKVLSTYFDNYGTKDPCSSVWLFPIRTVMISANPSGQGFWFLWVVLLFLSRCWTAEVDSTAQKSLMHWAALQLVFYLIFYS